jgi:hypothetical protein
VNITNPIYRLGKSAFPICACSKPHGAGRF